MNMIDGGRGIYEYVVIIMMGKVANTRVKGMSHGW